MIEFFYPILGIILVLIIFVFPDRTRTWFKGYGACDWHGQCYSKAKPRTNFKSLILNETEWYCDKHYDAKLRIRKQVEGEYRALQNKPNVKDTKK